MAGVYPAAETTTCGADGGIGTLVVVPGPNGNGPFIVMATTGLGNITADQCTQPGPDGGLPKTCIVEKRELTLIDHTPMVLPITMYHACENVICDGGLTCGPSGGCVPDLVNTDACSGAGCVIGALPDAGSPPPSHDAGHDATVPPHDSGHDATGSAHPDAGHDSGHDATLADVGVPHDAGHDTGMDAPPKQDTGVDAARNPCDGGKVLCGSLCADTCLTPIAENQKFPWAIAVQGGVVYWSTGCQEDVDGGGGNCATGASAILSSRTTGGGAASTVATTAVPAWAIALGADSIAWTGAGYGIGTGCGGTMAACSGVVAARVQDAAARVIKDPAQLPLGITVAGPFAYWVENNTGSIVRSPLDGGASVTLATGASGPGGIAVASPSLYWTNFNGGIGENGTVTKVAVDGGSVSTVAAGLDYVVNVATASDGGVYWISQGYGADEAGTVGGTTLPRVATGLGPWNLAVDEHNIYWADVSGGRIFRLPRSGGTPTAIVTDAGAPANVAVDDAAVYWTNNGTCNGAACNGTVMRFAPK
jgi:hypothetical protein